MTIKEERSINNACETCYTECQCLPTAASAFKMRPLNVQVLESYQGLIIRLSVH